MLAVAAGIPAGDGAVWAYTLYVGHEGAHAARSVWPGHTLCRLPAQDRTGWRGAQRAGRTNPSAGPEPQHRSTDLVAHVRHARPRRNALRGPS